MTLDLSAEYGVERFRVVRDRDLSASDGDLGRWLLVEPDQVDATGDPGVTGYDGPQHLGRWFDWSAPFAFPDWFLTDDDPVVQRIAARDLACLERLGIDHDPAVVADFARYTAQDLRLTRCYPMPARFRPRVVLDLGPGNGRLANAFLDGRGYVVPQDVKDIAPDVLRHRIATTYEAEAEEKTSDDIIQTILQQVRVP